MKEKWPQQANLERGNFPACKLKKIVTNEEEATRNI